MEANMKSKLLNLLLLLTSLIGYMEWSGNNQSFLFQVEGEVLEKLFTNPMEVLHPLTILPLIGQVLLIITLFQKIPSKTLTYISIGGLGVLLVLLFAIGLMSLNYKISAAALPFIVTAVVAIRHYRKIK